MRGARYLLVIVALGVSAFSTAVDVTAKSAIVIDASSGKVLWSKDANAQMYPASTTKIMTGLLLVEKCRPTDTIVAPADIETVKESSMHLKPGERVTARDMLYAIMLRSANDGCYAIATHISGSVGAFSKLMNERARQIGCTHTHFDNPNGLNDVLHTTTAHDLALIAQTAMKYPAFREAVRTVKYEITRSINTKDRWMVNHDKLLKVDPTADGVKTGYTVPAGHCFVGSTTRNGFRVITVVMKSAHWQLDHETLVNWAFKSFEKKKKIAAGVIVGTVKVPGAGDKTVAVRVAQNAYTLGPIGPKADKDTVKLEPAKNLKAPIKKGDHVGDLVLKDADGWVQRVPVVADCSVAAEETTKRQSPSAGSTYIFGGALFVGAVLMRSKVRRKTKYYGRTTTKQRR